MRTPPALWRAGDEPLLTGLRQSVSQTQRRLQCPELFADRSQTPPALTFPDISFFIHVLKQLERKIDERLRSATTRLAASR